MRLLLDTKTFLANTSIRGFSRIVRTDSHFVRILWILFILINSVILGISIEKIVKDYRRYSVNIQTYTKSDNGTSFPAVTFCNHQPFSKDAYDLWAKGEVMSPTVFNKLLRERALGYLEKLQKEPSASLVMKTLQWSTVLDSVRIYFQSLSPERALQIGHKQETMFHNCIFWYRESMGFSDSCSDHMLTIRRVSHPLYFNCYTVQSAQKHVSMDLSRIGVIVWLGPSELQHKAHTQGLMFDIFDQAYGLRVSLHEPNSYHNIDEIGMQIEPGRLNELNFHPVLQSRLDSSMKRCASTSSISKHRYPDMELLYNYDSQLCLNYHLQLVVLQRCRCFFASYPRPFTPNASHPYCGQIKLSTSASSSSNEEDSVNVLRRSNCVSTYLNSKEATDYKKKLEASQCLIRCTNIDYELAISVTKWRPTDWQLHWVKNILQTLEHYQNNIEALNSSSLNDTQKAQIELDMKKQYNEVRSFLTRSNLSVGVSGESGADHRKSETAENILFGDRFSFVVIKRRDNTTIVREERFVLTVSALISRIGGLCSLYLGLTFAFIVEVIEHCFTCLCDSSTNPSDTSHTASTTRSSSTYNAAMTVSHNNSNCNTIHRQTMTEPGADECVHCLLQYHNSRPLSTQPPSFHQKSRSWKETNRGDFVHRQKKTHRRISKSQTTTQSDHEDNEDCEEANVWIYAHKT